MTFRGWVFVLYGVVVILIYAVMGIRELRQRKRFGPQSPATEKVEGEFNRATWPLLVGFIAALFMSQAESRIDPIWWVGVLGLALGLSARALMSLRRESVGVGVTPTISERPRNRLRVSLLERQALFFGVLWAVALPIYAFIFDEDGKFVSYGMYETYIDWPKLFSWALIPTAFAIISAFAYERLIRTTES